MRFLNKKQHKMAAFAFCNVPVMPVRSEASHRAEQTTQLLYGERAAILETNQKGWAKITCRHDDYTGWCKRSQLTELSARNFTKPAAQLADGSNTQLIIGTANIALPIGAELIKLNSLKSESPFAEGKYKGKKIRADELQPTEENILRIAHTFLYAPYQWGGRTVAGIDCSGLTQIVLKLSGIAIPRDASQQAMCGTPVDFLQNSKCGDLAFFDEADGRITHVGLLLDTETIIHAADNNGRVSIDKIDQGGIVSRQLKKRTHKLRIIKRFF
jgi:gamma-D-glutamyl-L-lysine dipeptidyl-peptidase